MALREYTDSAGVQWTVWRIEPRFTPLRSGIDRRTRHTYVREERRILPDRRRRIVDSMVLRGWLCFESAEERRRLSPVPDDWESCSEAVLIGYCAAAQRARRSVPMDQGL